MPPKLIPKPPAKASGVGVGGLPLESDLGALRDVREGLADVRDVNPNAAFQKQAAKPAPTIAKPPAPIPAAPASTEPAPTAPKTAALPKVSAISRTPSKAVPKPPPEETLEARPPPAPVAKAATTKTPSKPAARQQEEEEEEPPAKPALPRISAAKAAPKASAVTTKREQPEEPRLEAPPAPKPAAVPGPKLAPAPKQPPPTRVSTIKAPPKVIIPATAKPILHPPKVGQPTGEEEEETPAPAPKPAPAPAPKGAKPAPPRPPSPKEEKKVIIEPIEPNRPPSPIPAPVPKAVPKSRLKQLAPLVIPEEAISEEIPVPAPTKKAAPRPTVPKGVIVPKMPSRITPVQQVAVAKLPAPPPAPVKQTAPRAGLTAVRGIHLTPEDPSVILRVNIPKYDTRLQPIPEGAVVVEPRPDVGESIIYTAKQLAVLGMQSIDPAKLTDKRTNKNDPNFYTTEEMKTIAKNFGISPHGVKKELYNRIMTELQKQGIVSKFEKKKKTAKA